MIAKFIKSMGYALKGIYTGIKDERNVRIDIVAMAYVLWFSTFYDLSRTERIVLVLICFNVLAFELMNTAVERAVDKPDKAHYMAAGQAKDTAAGGVLLAATGAAVAGIMLFWNVQVIGEIITYFTTDFIHAAILILSLLCAYFFITIDKYRNRK